MSVMMASVFTPSDPMMRLAAVPALDPLRDLFDARYAEMVRLAAAVLRDRAAAEDAVQEAFVSVDRALSRLPVDDHARYLRRAVMNACRSTIRRSGAAKRQPTRTRDGQLDGPDDTVVARERDDRVLAALDSLAFRQRQCIVLRYYAELTDAEVADALGISLGSAKTHLRRALDALGSTLGDLR